MCHTASPAKALLLQPFLISNTDHYVYLLVHRDGSAIKLGITGVLPLRLASLRAAHGDFDPHGSFVLRVNGRQVSRELEAELKTRFAAAHWRAVAPIPTGPHRRCGSVGGHTEWYAPRAFVPMLAALLNLHQRHRFSLVNDGDSRPAGMSLAEALGQVDPAGEVIPPAPKPIRTRPHHRDNAGWLAYSEANFATVRAWWDVHQHRLLSVSDPEPDHDNALRRTVRYAPASGQGTNPQGTEWDDLLRRASVRLRLGSTTLRCNFVDHVQVPADSAPVAVIFRLENDFFSDFGPERFVPATDLPRRIHRWVAGL